MDRMLTNLVRIFELPALLLYALEPSCAPVRKKNMDLLICTASPGTSKRLLSNNSASALTVDIEVTRRIS